MKTNQLLGLFAALICLILMAVLGLTQPETIVPALNAFLMIALGLGLGLVLVHRFKLPWGVYGAGMLTFFLSQVAHIPFNTWLLNPWLARTFPQPDPHTSDLLVWALALGLSAGLFEEVARWLVLRFWRKDIRSWKNTVMYGAGHGGFEAILVGVFAFIAFIQLFLYRQFDPQAITGLEEGAQLEALRMTLKTYWESDWYYHLWGSFERLSVLPFHIAAAVMVGLSVQKRQPLWLLAAIGWHTALDFVAVYGSKSWGIPQVEGAIFLAGLISLGIIFLLRDSRPPPEPDPIPDEPPSAAEPLPAPPQDQPLTRQDLEDSRYD